MDSLKIERQNGRLLITQQVGPAEIALAAILLAFAALFAGAKELLGPLPTHPAGTEADTWFAWFFRGFAFLLAVLGVYRLAKRASIEVTPDDLILRIRIGPWRRVRRIERRSVSRLRLQSIDKTRDLIFYDDEKGKRQQLGTAGNTAGQRRRIYHLILEYAPELAQYAPCPPRALSPFQVRRGFRFEQESNLLTVHLPHFDRPLPRAVAGIALAGLSWLPFHSRIPHALWMLTRLGGPLLIRALIASPFIFMCAAPFVFAWVGAALAAFLPTRERITVGPAQVELVEQIGFFRRVQRFDRSSVCDLHLTRRARSLERLIRLPVGGFSLAFQVRNQLVLFGRGDEKDMEAARHALSDFVPDLARLEPAEVPVSPDARGADSLTRIDRHVGELRIRIRGRGLRPWTWIRLVAWAVLPAAAGVYVTNWAESVGTMRQTGFIPAWIVTCLVLWGAAVWLLLQTRVADLLLKVSQERLERRWLLGPVVSFRRTTRLDGLKHLRVARTNFDNPGCARLLVDLNDDRLDLTGTLPMADALAVRDALIAAVPTLTGTVDVVRERP